MGATVGVQIQDDRGWEGVVAGKVVRSDQSVTESTDVLKEMDVGCEGKMEVKDHSKVSGLTTVAMQRRRVCI